MLESVVMTLMRLNGGRRSKSRIWSVPTVVSALRLARQSATVGTFDTCRTIMSSIIRAKRGSWDKGMEILFWRMCFFEVSTPMVHEPQKKPLTSLITNSANRNRTYQVI